MFFFTVSYVFCNSQELKVRFWGKGFFFIFVDILLQVLSSRALVLCYKFVFVYTAVLHMVQRKHLLFTLYTSKQVEIRCRFISATLRDTASRYSTNSLNKLATAVISAEKSDDCDTHEVC